MSLDEALSILARAHTGWDPKTGFTVTPLAQLHMRVDTPRYIDAWGIVRMHLHLNINPSPTPVESD